jgi:hypothetical protein
MILIDIILSSILIVIIILLIYNSKESYRLLRNVGNGLTINTSMRERSLNHLSDDLDHKYSEDHMYRDRKRN